MVALQVPAATVSAAVAPATAGAATQPATIRLSLLGSFALDRGGERCVIPGTAQRLLAFLAVHRSPIHRTYVAGSLWPEMSERRASGNLRTTLWRLHGTGAAIVRLEGENVALDPGAEVDLYAVVGLAQALLRGEAAVGVGGMGALERAGELLPGWYDDWVIHERETIKELRLRALEHLCRVYAAAERFGEAIAVGLTAIAGDPLRESTHRALIGAYLLEGNHVQAFRQYRRYRDDLESELGVAPSNRMLRLFADHGLPVAAGG